MENRQDVYDICRDYLLDHRDTMSNKLFQYVFGALRARDVAKLANCSSLLTPTKYGMEDYRVLRQVAAFFKKNSLFTDPDTGETAALTSFLEAEKVCRITNRRLDYYYTKRDRLDPDLRLWVSRIERDILDLLSQGGRDERDAGFGRFVDRLPSLIRVTSGASRSHGRKDSLPHLKVGRSIECTPRSRGYVKALAAFWGYKVRTKTVLTNRVTTVPKNWKTSRTIACEPTGNISLQLAFDEYLKEILPRWGVDLSNQDLNMRKAQQGSLDGSLATIDLSAASDTLSYNTVAWLLPLPWFEYLNNVRCPFFKFGSDLFGKYAKFSSMGNGATFPLETLIFSACCRAIGSKNFSVYGDDIIVETELVSDLLKLLRFLGFTPNEDKTFTTGLFRESCGGDFFQGVDITPFYLRKSSRRKAFACHNVNGLMSIALPQGRLWRRMLEVVASRQLPLVPFNENTLSGVFIHCHDAWLLGLIRNRWGIPMYKAYVPEGPKPPDIRGYPPLFLWFLDKNRLKKPDKRVIRGRMPVDVHRYVRDWVRWIPPATVVPYYIYVATDDLLAQAS